MSTLGRAIAGVLNERVSLASPEYARHLVSVGLPRGRKKMNAINRLISQGRVGDDDFPLLLNCDPPALKELAGPIGHLKWKAAKSALSKIRDQHGNKHVREVVNFMLTDPETEQEIEMEFGEPRGEWNDNPDDPYYDPGLELPRQYR